MEDPRNRGFTLIEIVTVLGIITVLAALAIGVSRGARRNASLGSATYEMAQNLRELRFKAMTENRDYTFIFVDSAAADAKDCTLFSSGGCARWWILRTPGTWTFADFTPATPVGGGAEYVESDTLPSGAHLNMELPFTAPAPFTGALLGDAALTTDYSGRKCFAIRFEADSQVSAVSASGSSVPKKVGYAFGLSSSYTDESAALEARLVLVTFPSGIVKVFNR